VVDDLAAATEFFVELGLELQGEAPVGGRSVDRVVGLDGVRAQVAMMQTPDGNGRLESAKFHSPSNQGDSRYAPPTPRVSATSHSPSKTSMPSSLACEPAARSSSASWSARRTATGSATSAARRGSSSGWPSRPAAGPVRRRPPTNPSDLTRVPQADGHLRRVLRSARTADRSQPLSPRRPTLVGGLSMSGLWDGGLTWGGKSVRLAGHSARGRGDATRRLVCR
jgi:hypothetical protein